MITSALPDITSWDTSLFIVPPIPSTGPLQWLVAKKSCTPFLPSCAMLDNNKPSLNWLAAPSENTSDNFLKLVDSWIEMLQNGFWGRRSQHTCHIVGSQKQSQLNVYPHASKHMQCIYGNLIVCPVNWLTKAINFSGKIPNKVHLYHNPTFFATSFTLFRWAVYPLAWSPGPSSVCYKKKV